MQTDGVKGREREYLKDRNEVESSTGSFKPLLQCKKERDFQFVPPAFSSQLYWISLLFLSLCVYILTAWAKSDTKPHYEDIWFLIELKNGLKCSFFRQNKAFINIQLKYIKAFAF